MNENNNFEKIKNEAESAYKTLNKIYCPYLKDFIFFNTEGLEHLKFKSRKKARLEADQYMRFRLLSLAPEILEISHTLQGIWEIKHIETIRTNNRDERVLKDVTYYEFIAIYKNYRVKIIIKQVGLGQKIFWSIIPFWKMRNNKRILHEGTPSED